MAAFLELLAATLPVAVTPRRTNGDGRIDGDEQSLQPMLQPRRGDPPGAGPDPPDQSAALPARGRSGRIGRRLRRDRTRCGDGAVGPTATVTGSG